MIEYNKKNGINSIHNYPKAIEGLLNKLSKMKDNNSKKILELHNENVINGLAEATQLKYLGRLLTISKWTNKDFEKLTKEDLIEIIGKNLSTNRYSESSAKTMRVVIKRFFQWLKGCNRKEYPIEVSWIRTTGNKNLRKHKNPEDMINDDDIGKMVNVVSHPRNKAFIMTLAESGCRVGEILTLTKKKICFDNQGCYFLVDGKTGTRRVRVVNSTPFLHAWLSVHPNKDDDNAPLWVNIGTTKNIINNLKENEENNYKMEWKYNMTYAAARKLLQVAGEKAGIKKPINPHNFRHSRATKLCSLGISGNILNEYFGWTQASRSVSTYLHLSGKQVDDTLLSKAYGMQIQETNELPKMLPIKCFSCGELNEHNVSRCKKCNSIIGQLSNDDLEEQKTISQLLKLFGGFVDKDNNLKTQFIETIKNEIISEIKLSYQKEKIIERR